MLNAALVTCVLGAVCVPNLNVVTTVPDVGACGFDFVMGIVGYSANQVFTTSEGSTVVQALPDGRRIEITLQRIRADARDLCSPRLRVMADVGVSVVSGDLTACSRARIIMGADTAIGGTPAAGLGLTITPIPDTLVATSDAPNAPQVEEMIKAAAVPLAAKLSGVVPLQGVGTLAAARPPEAPPLEARVYQLGFEWIIQIAAPAQTQHAEAPSVFLQGSIFTLVLSASMVQELASAQLASGQLPSQMSTAGLFDTNGPIRITSVTTALEPGAVVLEWHGEGPAGPANITWRLAFVPSVNELALRLQQVVVNGEVTCIPESANVINPIGELIRRITTGPATISALVSPLGRTRLLTAEITSYAILVAGRV